jgi:hypothetical protein
MIFDLIINIILSDGSFVSNEAPFGISSPVDKQGEELIKPSFLVHIFLVLQIHCYYYCEELINYIHSHVIVI